MATLVSAVHTSNLKNKENRIALSRHHRCYLVITVIVVVIINTDSSKEQFYDLSTSSMVGCQS